MMADAEGRKRVVAPCPWCGDGTALKLRGDGLGGTSLWCTKCTGKGPRAVVLEDFAAAEEEAIRLWSARAGAVAPELVERVRGAARMAALMGGGSADANSEVSLRYGDVEALLRAATGGAEKVR